MKDLKKLFVWFVCGSVILPCAASLCLLYLIGWVTVSVLRAGCWLCTAPMRLLGRDEDGPLDEAEADPEDDDDPRDALGLLLEWAVLMVSFLWRARP